MPSSYFRCVSGVFLDLAFYRPELLSGVGFSLSSQAEKVTSSNEANRFVVPGRRNLFTGSGSQPDLDWQIWIAHAPRQMARTASLAENGDPGTLKTAWSSMYSNP